MTQEQEKTLEALKTAIQMEIDGKEFYLKASAESKNDMGRKLLETLSKEEDYHRRKFEEIYAIIEKKTGWPKTEFDTSGGNQLRTIFSEMMTEISTEKETLQTEIDTVQKAMDMESASRDFYNRQRENSVHIAEKQFYEKIADEERQHFLVLLDYFEYLKDPAAWFVEKEHPSLDGG
ncbi:MAG: ferritin family protein [Dehalococcoidales bacterium]|nr:ferritin family protein [Dehalococcoidales bacterium]